MDFISIIIPAYNSQRWLARCLDSVLAAADVECEIVIVDDGSLDRTPQIIEEYAEKDPRITSLRTDHVGPCASRLEGFRESTGDYIMFVDSDDTLPPDSIAVLRQLLRHPSEDEINEDTKREQRRYTDGIPHIVIANIIRRTEYEDCLLIKGQRRALTGLELSVEILEGEMPRFLVGHLFSRQLMEAVDWDNNPHITQLEHAYMMFTLAMKAEEWNKQGRGGHVILVDPTKNVYNYLIRPGSQSSMMSPTHDGFEAIWSHLTSLGLPERELTVWGLRVLRNSFIHRGIPFSDSFAMAVDLKERARRLTSPLPDDLAEIADSLSSKSKRLKIARRLSRTVALADVSPHLTFVIPSRGSIKKVRRTVKSIYDTGFRNIEVILVDTNDDYKTSVGLNEINVSYPRVKIVRTAPHAPVIQANFRGLMEAKGLGVMFVRPGDRVIGTGTYRSLIHLDQGADLVMVNIRRFSPVTGCVGKSEDNSAIVGSDVDEKKNYASVILDLLNRGQHHLAPRLRANIWRREALLDADIPSFNYENVPDNELASATMKHILSGPFNVVVQSPAAAPAYDIALDGFSIADHLSPTGKGADTEHMFKHYGPR
ncbi:MAG: glycosyltransferase [Muribaculaceae bacterium]|nr:glycosyltransferase [Muribaculaceae bacterium]